jgi:hypothetical protein
MLAFSLSTTTPMKRAHEGCDSCYGIVRTLQTKCNMLSEQLAKVEKERDVWKYKFENYLKEHGVKCV